VRALLLPRGQGKDEFKERRKETRHTPGVLKKEDPPARRGQPGRRAEGGSSGRKDTATVRRYKTILFLPSSISFLLFFHFLRRRNFKSAGQRYSFT